MAMLSHPVSAVMSNVRPPASGDPHRDDGRPGPFWRSLRHPSTGLAVWAALAASLTGGSLTALGIVLGGLAPTLAGVVLAAGALGLAAGISSVARVPHTDGGLRADLGLRSLMSAAGLIVCAFLLALTASVTGDADVAGRTLIRATGLAALVMSFGTLGYALVMRREPGGRHRPDWVFVAIGVLMTGVTLVQVYDRLALVLLLA